MNNENIRGIDFPTRKWRKPCKRIEYGAGLINDSGCLTDIFKKAYKIK